MRRINNRLVVILSVIAVVVAGAIFAVWYNSFRIASVSPNPSPSVVTQIEFKFSRPLDKSYDVRKVSVTNNAKGSFKLYAQSIVFKPSGQLPEGGLTFTFPDIRSTSGDQTTMKATVAVHYVPFNQLPKDEQKRQINKSSSNQDEFPITNGFVPHAAATWGVEYALPTDTQVDKLTLIVTPYIDRGTREAVVDYNNRLEDVRKEFEFYISSNGFKLSDYYLLYANPYLSRYDQASQNGPYSD